MSVLCLVPTRMRAARAARRLCDAEGGVLFGARVCTPDALVPELLAAAGDGRILLPALAERLLVTEAGREAGGPFTGLEPWDGRAGALAQALAELRQGAATAEEVEAAASGTGAGERLTHVAAALRVYERRLRELGAIDRPGALRAAVDALEHGVVSDELRELDLLVLEGFTVLAPPALDLLTALARRARRTHAHIPFTPERADISGPAEALLRRLEGLHELSVKREVVVALEPLAADGTRGERLAGMLAAVAGGRGGGGLGVAPPWAGLALGLAGAGARGEAEVVASLLRSWLAEGLHERCRAPGSGQVVAGAPARSGRLSGGDAARPTGDLDRPVTSRGERGEPERLLPEDLVVLCASPERTAPLLARACAELGVPLSLGRGTVLAELPPVRAVRDALAAAVRPDRSALERLARSPYLGFASGSLARLGPLLDWAGALDGDGAEEAGGPSPGDGSEPRDRRGDAVAALQRRAHSLRSASAARERAATSRAAEALSELRVRIAPLGGNVPPHAHAERLRGFLASVGARRRAARAELPLALRDLTALAQVDEVADEVARSLTLVGQGASPMTATRWAALLDLALEGAQARPSPEPVAGAVELWPLSEAPGLSARGCVVMGCERGAFPAMPDATAPLLREVEREALRHAAGRAVVPAAAERRARALHTAFSALAVGREAVALTWVGPGPEGEGASPAPLAVEALLVAGAQVPDRRSTAAARHASPDVVEPGARPGDCLGRGLGADRRSSVLARGALEWERLRTLVTGVASVASGRLPPELGGELAAALPAEWSPSQLETHARCPFRFFAGTLLRLGEPEAADLDLDPRDEGSLAHAALERLFRDLATPGAVPFRDDAAARRALERTVAEVFEELEASGRAGDPATWPGRRGAVLARLSRVLAAETALVDVAAPALLEYRFGGDSGVPALSVVDPVLGEVRLRGRIDRVDVAPGRLLLVDYKDSRVSTAWKRKLSLDALGVSNFQIPTYLLAAARALPGRQELAATYLLLRSAERLEPLVLGVPSAEATRATGADVGPAPSAEPSTPRSEIEPPASALTDPGQWIARFERSVSEIVERVRTGEVAVRSDDCTGCPYGAVCRAEGRSEAAA